MNKRFLVLLLAGLAATTQMHGASPIITKLEGHFQDLGPRRPTYTAADEEYCSRSFGKMTAAQVTALADSLDELIAKHAEFSLYSAEEGASAISLPSEVLTPSHVVNRWARVKDTPIYAIPEQTEGPHRENIRRGGKSLLYFNVHAILEIIDSNRLSILGFTTSSYDFDVHRSTKTFSSQAERNAALLPKVRLALSAAANLIFGCEALAINQEALGENKEEAILVLPQYKRIAISLQRIMAVLTQAPRRVVVAPAPVMPAPAIVPAPVVAPNPRQGNPRAHPRAESDESDDESQPTNVQRRRVDQDEDARGLTIAAEIRRLHHAERHVASSSTASSAPTIADAAHAGWDADFALSQDVKARLTNAATAITTKLIAIEEFRSLDALDENDLAQQSREIRQEIHRACAHNGDSDVRLEILLNLYIAQQANADFMQIDSPSAKTDVVILLALHKAIELATNSSLAPHCEALGLLVTNVDNGQCFNIEHSFMVVSSLETIIQEVEQAIALEMRFVQGDNSGADFDEA